MFDGEFQLYGRIINAKIKCQNLCWAIQASMNKKSIYYYIINRQHIEFLYISNKKKIIDKELLAKMGKSCQKYDDNSKV